jgi:hypothetical protein
MWPWKRMSQKLDAVILLIYICLRGQLRYKWSFRIHRTSSIKPWVRDVNWACWRDPRRSVPWHEQEKSRLSGELPRAVVTCMVPVQSEHRLRCIRIEYFLMCRVRLYRMKKNIVGFHIQVVRKVDQVPSFPPSLESDYITQRIHHPIRNWRQHVPKKC